jgi:hypothetical protein
VLGASNRIGNDEILLVKYNPSGQFQWEKRYVGTAQGVDDGRAVVVNRSTGDIYITGFSLSTAQGFDYLTARYTSSGVLMWSKRYDGTGHDYDVPERIRVDSVGNCYVAGMSTSVGSGLDYAIVKYDKNGNQIWDRRYDGGSNLNDEPRGLAIDSTGALMVAGGAQQSTNGPNDMVTVRLIQSNVLSGSVSLQNFTGAAATIPVEVEIYAAGTQNVLDSGNAILDANGQFVFATQLGSGTFDIRVKATHWLKKLVSSVVFSSSGASGVNFVLKNGDIDGDNEVAIGDYSLLSFSFNSGPGDSNWTPNADLNGDDSVDIGDFSIMSLNFGQQGD